MSNKKTLERFLGLVEGRMSMLGYSSDTSSYRGSMYALYYTISTKVGELVIAIRESTDFPLFVHTRFSNPNAASQLVNCNMFSGKWNFYLYLNEDFEGELERFFDNLCHVLLPKDMTLMENVEDVEVVFRKYKNGAIIALFPYEIQKSDGRCKAHFLDYSKVVDYKEVVRDTKAPEESEISPLLKKLHSESYSVTIAKRRSPKRYMEALRDYID